MTSAVPTNCTACGTPIPPGAMRCPACGRIFGEVNRCPSCNAIAAVRASGDAYVCAACGAPRDYRPGMLLMGGPGLGLVPSPSTKTWAKSVAVTGGAIGLRIASVAAAGASLVVAGIVAVVSGTGVGLAAGGVIGAAGLALAALLYTLGSRASRTAQRMSSSAEELEILTLAEKLGGSLYATDAARALGISVAEAESRLSALQDGTRVVAEVTPEGLIRFDFRELRARGSQPAVRIAPPETANAAEAEIVRDETAEKRAGR